MSTKEFLVSADVAGRLDRLRGRFATADCDALVVTKLENVRYLTGFTGSAALLVVRPDAALLLSDRRYRDQASNEIAAHGVQVDIEIASSSDTLEAVSRFAGSLGRIGLEADSCTWAQQRRFAERFNSSELVPTSGVVEALRIVKDEGELSRIAMACEIADIALAQVKDRLREEITESEFAAELEFEMRQRGSAAPAFSTIVASGPNSAMPHARPTDRTIREGDLVVVDFGATTDGYKSDMTRTFCLGDPEGDLANLFDAVFAAQRAGVRAVQAGATAASVDLACREVLNEAGYGENFLHSTGHGVGIEIHEAPWVSARSADILPLDTVVTVEPGAYVFGRGGVRIEDTVVVADSGTRVLTKSTKDHVL